MATHAVHIVVVMFFADMAMLLVHCQDYVQVLCGREGVVSNYRDRWRINWYTEPPHTLRRTALRLPSSSIPLA